MNLLSFLLECVLVAVAVGGGVSIVVAMLHALFRPWAIGWSPALRADLLFAGAILPGALAFAVTVAAAGPSVLAWLGLHADHCGEHLHHSHLCLLHAFEVPISRILIAAFALALLSFRAIYLALSIAAHRKTVRALEALGTAARYGRSIVVRVPGGPKLCHAVGLFKRRVLLSARLEAAISKAQLEAALAHEQAHHDRLDGLAAFLVRLTAVFYAPVIMRGVVRAHREAMEEAADARAAVVIGDPQLVAETIVSIAKLQLANIDLQNGITGAAIEQRVMRLLQTSCTPVSGTGGVWWTLGAVSLLASAILLAANPVHHAVETLLYLI